jgi:hypothetical protein
VNIGRGDDNQGAYLTIGGTSVGKFGYQNTISGIVPNGVTYSIPSGTTFSDWAELS